MEIIVLICFHFLFHYFVLPQSDTQRVVGARCQRAAVVKVHTDTTMKNKTAQKVNKDVVLPVVCFSKEHNWQHRGCL